MLADLKEFERRLERSADTRWITTTVAMLATLVFVVSGSQVLPITLGLSSNYSATEQGLVTAFLLNVALVLFAWRRSVQLRLSFAERDQANRQAIKLAYVDDVTGLYNRRYFNERLARAAETADLPTVLLLIDLDRFKEINDLHGHEAGDRVLVAVAERLSAACPPGSFCVRLGGDEFAILLTGETAEEDRPESLADALLGCLNDPLGLSGMRTALGASIGIATFGQRRDPSLLLRRSDIAMYEAKRLGRNRWTRFDIKLERELTRRNAIEAELRDGIANDRFVPYFQPVISLATGQTTGFEVLARWEHPVKGLVEPDAFIAEAEQLGLIGELSLRVMERALEISKSWPNELKIAVNISPLQFKDPLLAQRILKVLTKVGFPAWRLELEIMESSLIGDRPLALRTVESLRNLGVSVAIDDFGTGYSPQMDSRSLPYDRIKIDRGFVAALLEDEQCDAIVRSIAILGKGLSIPITAEGVETEAIRAKLQGLGCVDAQGWLFAKPLSAEEAIRSLAAAGAAPSSQSSDSLAAAG